MAAIQVLSFDSKDQRFQISEKIKPAFLESPSALLWSHIGNMQHREPEVPSNYIVVMFLQFRCRMTLVSNKLNPRSYVASRRFRYSRFNRCVVACAFFDLSFIPEIMHTYSVDTLLGIFFSSNISITINGMQRTLKLCMCIITVHFPLLLLGSEMCMRVQFLQHPPK